MERQVRSTRCRYGPWYMEFRLSLSKNLFETLEDTRFKDGAFAGKFNERTPPEEMITEVEASGLADQDEIIHFLHPMLASLARCTTMDEQREPNKRINSEEMRTERQRLSDLLKAYRAWIAYKRHPTMQPSERIRHILTLKKVQDEAAEMVERAMRRKEKFFADEEEPDLDPEEGGVQLG